MDIKESYVKTFPKDEVELRIKYLLPPACLG